MGRVRVKGWPRPFEQLTTTARGQISYRLKRNSLKSTSRSLLHTKKAQPEQSKPPARPLQTTTQPATTTRSTTLHHKPPPQPCLRHTSAKGKAVLSLSSLKSLPTLTLPNRQNNDSLSALSAKVSALRSVTVDIYDNARDQHVIDNTSESFSNMTTSIKGSARRLGVMASQGNKVAVLKLAGIIVATVVVLWWILSWFW